jgi:predicted nuclease of predicted toxin-antitoxin system
MKLKLDENLPYGLSSTLGSLGHDVHTVYEENLTGHVDAEICDSAQREGRFLLTQDLTFLTRESSSRAFIMVSCWSA